MKGIDALAQACIGDTSFLSNFIFPNRADLLIAVLKRPVNISPTVLDENEPANAFFLQELPSSELMRPLYFAKKAERRRYEEAENPLRQFILGMGTLWSPVTPTEEELKQALTFSQTDIWKTFPEAKRRRRGLDAGEAEAAAIAVSRGWTFLTDDQAAVDLMSELAPEVATIRTCSFLVRAVNEGHILCEEAVRLFNNEMCSRWGFYARRKKVEILRLRCSPAECGWDRIGN